MQDQIPELNYTNFNNFLKNKVVLVDFWAEWCYPCKQQLPILKKLADGNKELFSFATLNVDDNKVISSRLGVQNIPTLILYNNGEEVRRIIGLQTGEMILNQIKVALSHKN